MNRIKELFQKKSSGILSVYFTAGFPKLDDTSVICRSLEDAGTDLIEIGIPFSDPVADGPTIQESNSNALKNGMTLQKLFEQIKGIRKNVNMPIILMGYFNPILQYGLERFCSDCEAVGIDGTIIPDLPFDMYVKENKQLFDNHNLKNIFLVTPQTSPDRVKQIDEHSDGFIYAVSSAAVTGGTLAFDEARKNYLERLKKMDLKNPILVGFGIATKADLEFLSYYVNGGIIGSAFVRAIADSIDLHSDIKAFIGNLR